MDDSNRIIQLTEAFVKDRLSGEGTGHDWWHAIRVVNIAKTIHQAEGGDWLVINLALLLHDVGDRKVINKDDDDYSIVQDFLVSIDADQQLIEQVMAIIKTMSFSKSFDNVPNNNSIEFKIVQDADRLDAIGAIGIARAFAYGGSKGRLLYDPEYQAQSFTSSSDYKNAVSSTIHHFDEKLFLLKDMLNTDMAKQIVTQRDEYMHQFVDQFIKEWEGER